MPLSYGNYVIRICVTHSFFFYFLLVKTEYGRQAEKQHHSSKTSTRIMQQKNFIEDF
jgi:hypothetical protein